MASANDIGPRFTVKSNLVGHMMKRSKALFMVMDDLLSCHSSICMYYVNTWVNSDNSLRDDYNFWDTSRIVSYRNIT